MEDVSSITRLSPQEQIYYEKLQNLYSIIKTLEYLEWAYMSGKVKGPEYDSECRSLLHQFNLSKDSVQNFQGIDEFMKTYNLNHCQSAKRRIEEGKSGYKGEDFDKNMAQRVYEITQKMITAIDLVSLDYNQVDQLAPAVKDIQNCLNNYPNLPSRYTGSQTIAKWVGFFQGKKASEELNQEEVRQLKYELETCMSEFNEVVLGSK